ncbi:MAG: bacillithiol biosynthesis deacetylase BshB1 [Calditrichaceae bacterium]
MIEVMNLNILAFGAHPDDVELFCSGTLIKMTDLGYSAGIIDMTRGELSTRGNPETRSGEAEKAASIINARIRVNVELPDGDIVNNRSNRMKIIELLRFYKPEIVILPYWEDRHPDHVNASELLKAACFQSGLAKINSGTEPHRPEYMLYYFNHAVAQPSFVVDISDEFDRKMKAIKSYGSQFHNPASNEPETYISSRLFMESVETRAKYFGFQIGVTYGEPFVIESVLKVNNLFDIFS